MVLSKDTNPTNSVYRTGALLLKVIIEKKGETMDFIDAYNKLNEKHNVSISAFMFAIDWLFLLGRIEMGRKLELKKCF